MAYKVKALYLSGRGKKVFRSGDIVRQEHLNAPVLELLQKGFLTEFEGETEDEKEPELDQEGLKSLEDLTPPAPDEEKEVKPETEVKVQEEEKETEKEVKAEEDSVNPLLEETKAVKIPEIGEVNYEFLINELKNLGVSHKANISKKEAYELWLGAQK